MGWLWSRLDRGSAEHAATGPTHCFSCQKPRQAVDNFVALKDDIALWEKCIALLAEIVAEQNADWRRRLMKSLMKRDRRSGGEVG